MILFSIVQNLISTNGLRERCQPNSILVNVLKFEFSDGIIEISQKKFINNLLIKFGMSDCKSVSTPLALAEKQKFTKFAQTDKTEFDNTTYRSLVGSLKYLALSTRPDLSQAAHILSPFLEVPKAENWIAAKHVRRYLKGTKHLNLTFRKTTSVDDNLAGYSIYNCKSTTAFVLICVIILAQLVGQVKSKIVLLHLQQRLTFTHVFQLHKNWYT